ncbi:hypothetical protein [Rhodococcus sp. USK13]|uniref:hypothetical protein n=1 Tax=Rhodococcus sp. USK13 TaxID=2806442 RepID=UPI001BCD2C28|nr:hypothetical protein [Rhodococcus sp. USK13]
MTTKLDARDVITLLRNHYNAPNRPKGWLFAPEIQAPNSDRRADLITAPLTRSGGSAIIGHEVKVSRSDVLAELADPTKHDDWAKYCDRWYLVVSDPTLVEGLDIPDHWGIMAPPSGRRTRSMTIIRKAPKLSPIGSSDGWMKLARWQTFRADEGLAEAARDVAWKEREADQLRAQVQNLQAAGTRSISPHLQTGLDLINRVSRRTSDEELWGNVDLDAIAAAVVDVEATRRAAETQRREIEALERYLDPARGSLAKHLASAKRLGAQGEIRSAS